jgi:hypothetical protein
MPQAVRFDQLMRCEARLGGSARIRRVHRHPVSLAGGRLHERQDHHF